MYDITAKELAEYILTEFEKENHNITNNKMNMILYCIQDDYLDTTGKLLFEDKCAIINGAPRYKNVYNEYDSLFNEKSTSDIGNKLHSEDKKLIDKDIEMIKCKTCFELINLVCNIYYKNNKIEESNKLLEKLIQLEACNCDNCDNEAIEEIFEELFDLEKE